MSDDVDDMPPRPRTRGECAGGERPCPWVSCRHHLYLDVASRWGATRNLREDVEPWDLEETCALDVADRGGVTLEDVGAALGVTKERVRQIEAAAVQRMRAAASRALADPPRPATQATVRRLPVVTVSAVSAVATPTPTPPKVATARAAGQPAASRRRPGPDQRREPTPAEIQAARIAAALPLKPPVKRREGDDEPTWRHA